MLLTRLGCQKVRKMYSALIVYRKVIARSLIKACIFVDFDEIWDCIVFWRYSQFCCYAYFVNANWL